MSTKTFTINGHEVLAVQVPERSTITCIYNGNLIFTSNQHMQAITLPHGDWGVVCNKPCSEWSEAEAATILPLRHDPGPDRKNMRIWENYTIETDGTHTHFCSAKKSLHSLLTSKELNPAETVLLRKKV